MSETYATAAQNIRRLIGDNDLGATVFDTPFDIYGLLTPKMQQMAARAGHGQTWSAGLFSCVAGSPADVNLSASIQFAQILEVRDPVNGRPLTRISMEEIERLRLGIIASSNTQSDPMFVAFYEDVDQKLYARFDTVPVRAIAYDVLRSAIPTTGYLDTTTIPLCEEFCRGLEFAVAGLLLKRASKEQLARLSITPAFADECKIAEETGIRMEAFRLGNLTRRPWGVGAVAG